MVDRLVRPLLGGAGVAGAAYAHATWLAYVVCGVVGGLMLVVLVAGMAGALHNDAEKRKDAYNVLVATLSLFRRRPPDDPTPSDSN